ncbi:MAG: hypothetical protein ACP5I1_12435 [Candidatus Hinthialibacter sp.]
MKKRIGIITLLSALALAAYAQDEYVVVNDFEYEIGSFTNWASDYGFTYPEEPRHSGEAAAYLNVIHEGGWASSIYTFETPFDARNADEFRMWVYSDQPFRLRVDLEVEIVMGNRYYTPDDVGTWKEFMFWISEEQSKIWEDALEAADQIRFWINPSAETHDGVEYPNGFIGLIYMDDMSIHMRKPVEREYKTIIGFNDEADADLVTLANGTYFEIMETDNPEPTEGDGFLLFDYTSGWNENFTINLKGFPEILDYDRIHLDLLIEQTGDWASCSLLLRASWTDADGNSRGTGWATLGEYIVNRARGEAWEELSGQYGPVESEGFSLNWLKDEISGVFDDPEGTISLTIITQGGESYDLALAYLDNIRLSRPVGTGVSEWALY